MRIGVDADKKTNGPQAVYAWGRRPARVVIGLRIEINSTFLQRSLLDGL
jgi:hypothetical protein